MPLSFDEMLAHPDLQQILLVIVHTFVKCQQEDPRMTGIFGTQQRWLLAHAAMSIYFRDRIEGGPGLHATDFLELVDANNIAARYTAHAFLKEMIHYGVIVYVAGRKGAKPRQIDLSEPAIDAITRWLLLHLKALDRFDGGSRCDRFKRNPRSVALLQPEITLRLLTSPDMRIPKGSFSIFTWLNNGGLVMDWVMLCLTPVDASVDRIPTSITSISELAERLKLSRTHLGRKLRDAEELGSLGWTGRRGKSNMWLSKDFRDEYYSYQMKKLVIVDDAFDAILPRLDGG